MNLIVNEVACSDFQWLDCRVSITINLEIRSNWNKTGPLAPERHALCQPKTDSSKWQKWYGGQQGTYIESVGRKKWVQDNISQKRQIFSQKYRGQRGKDRELHTQTQKPPLLLRYLRLIIPVVFNVLQTSRLNLKPICSRKRYGVTTCMLFPAVLWAHKLNSATVIRASVLILQPDCELLEGRSWASHPSNSPRT